MPNTVIALKKSATPSATPLDLANGELAINYADGVLYYKAANGSIASIRSGGGNSYGTVNANNTLIVAGIPNDILSLIAGNNIVIVGDAVNDRVTLSVKDTPVFTGDVIGNRLISNNSIGNEGGEIVLATAQTGNSLSTSVTIDIYGNQLRFFETGGTNRGAFIDLGIAGTGVSSNLLAGGTGGTTDATAREWATGAFAKANAALPNTSGVSFNGNLTVSQNLSADRIFSTNNGNGENFKVGDDSWIGDYNVANSLRIKGQQNTQIGYISFGDRDGQSLGRAGTGPLTWNGSTIWHDANDGAGSGLDADLLDGQQGTYYGIASDVTGAFASANAAFNRANTANITADRAWNHANAAFSNANTVMVSAQSAFTQANIAFANANTVMVSAQAAFTVANSGFLHANASYSFANSIALTANAAFLHANAAFANGNTVIQTAQSAFTLANISYAHANAAHATANAAFASANAGQATANAAFANANTVMVSAQSAFTLANIAFAKANTANITADRAWNHANSAFDKANTSLQTSGGTVSGNLAITGTLTVQGNVYLQDTQTLTVSDPLIYLAGNNYSSDIVDIGFVANYVNATGQNVHTGIFRDATIKEYYIFEAYDKEPNPNHIDTAGNNFTISVLNATLKTSNLILGGTNTIPWITAAFNRANTANITADRAWNHANAAFANANTVMVSAQSAFTQANIAFANANTAMISAQAAFTVANSGFLHANAAFAFANSAHSIANLAFTHANNAYAAANTANNMAVGNTIANGMYQTRSTRSQLNFIETGQILYNIVDDSAGNRINVSANIVGITPVAITANAAFLHANAVYAYANSISTTANAAFLHANASYAFANSISTTANLAFIHANNAYAAANSAGAAKANVGNNSPTGNTSGTLWWNSDLGRLLIYYNDGDTNQWVDATPTGDVGPRGFSGNIQIGTITTGVPGSQASATNSGNGDFAIFDITIPRGNVGATGPLAPKGITIPIPQANDEYTIMFTEVALTMTQIRCITLSSTTTANATTNASFYYGTSRNSGTAITTNFVVGNTFAGNANTTFTNASIPANNWIWVDINATVNSPAEFHSSLFFTVA